MLMHVLRVLLLFLFLNIFSFYGGKKKLFPSQCGSCYVCQNSFLFFYFSFFEKQWSKSPEEHGKKSWMENHQISFFTFFFSFFGFTIKAIMRIKLHSNDRISLPNFLSKGNSYQKKSNKYFSLHYIAFISIIKTIITLHYKFNVKLHFASFQ